MSATIKVEWLKPEFCNALKGGALCGEARAGDGGATPPPVLFLYLASIQYTEARVDLVRGDDCRRDFGGRLGSGFIAA